MSELKLNMLYRLFIKCKLFPAALLSFTMRRYIILIPTYLIICSSCATIFNRSTQRIEIITNKPADVQINDKILINFKNRTEFVTARDVIPIQLSVFNDSVTKILTLNSKGSFAYWMNIFYNAGLGMLVDNKSPKRYGYPNKVYVDMTNNLNSFTTYNPEIRQGSLQLHCSLPYINNFLLNPIDEDKSKYNTGFMGVLIGFDYYYKTNRYLNLSTSGVMDFFIPFPAAVDFSGEMDFMSSWYFCLSNNYRIKRFSVGYGISYSKNTWDHRYYEWLNPPPPERDPITKTDYSFGFVFPFYFQPGKHFFLGLIYRPSFLTVKPVTVFKYDHLISIDFAWKIPLIR